MKDIKDVKKQFLACNGFNSGTSADNDFGLYLSYDPKTKIDMKCDLIFEGSYFDDEIKCNPAVGIFNSAEECWNNFENDVTTWLENSEF